MDQEQKEQEQVGAVPRLGKEPEERVQRYFCIDDEECRAFARVSKEARVVRRTPKRIRVMGRDVQGWIVEITVPATDGVVRVDPMADERGSVRQGLTTATDGMARKDTEGERGTEVKPAG